MIPKTIHYVWVGGKEKPKDMQKCMKTWSKHLKDYKIIEWNENNFDINSHPFCKRAYEAKKWAFVSDYIRCWVMYREGGIYLDTDVLLLDNFDKFLSNKAFVGFENEKLLFAAVFGVEKKHPLIKDMLDYYDNLEGYSFKFDENNSNLITKLLVDNYGCKINNQKQLLKEDIAVYPNYVLCNPSINSTSVHVFSGTWLDYKIPIVRKLNKFLKLQINSKRKAELFGKYITHRGKK